MYCPQCGNPLESGNRFCVICGAQAPAANVNARRDGAPASQDAQATQVIPKADATTKPLSFRNDEWQQTDRKKPPLGAIIGILAGIALALGVVVLVTMPHGQEAASSAASSQETESSASQESEAASSSQAAQESGSASASASSASEQGQSESTQAESESEQQEEPVQPAVDPNGDFVLVDSASRAYSTEELEALDDHTLFLARNEIFARHGCGFKSQELRDWFASKSWYHETQPAGSYGVDILNETERNNVNAMLEIEKARNSPYL